MSSTEPQLVTEAEGPRGTGRPVLLGAAFLGLLCGFVGIFIGLSLGGLRELRNTAALRADPLGATSIQARIQSSDSPVLLLGDSRVNQWHPLPEVDGTPVESIGVPGLTATQLAGAIGLLSPDLRERTVLVQIGINDLKSIGYSDRPQEEIVESTREAIATIHDELVRSGARVRVMTVIPPGPVRFSRRFIWTDRINQSVAALNEELVSGALVPEESVLDIREALGGTSSIDPAFARDTLHLKPEGYEALEPLVIEAAAANSAIRN